MQDFINQEELTAEQSKKNMANAKAKWENDLEFVRDFNLSKQKQIAAKKIRFK